MNWEPWLPPIAILAGGVAIGVGLEWWGLRRLRRMSESTAWRGDDIIAAGLRGLPMLWTTLLAMHIAVTKSPFEDSSRLIIHRFIVVGIIVSATILAMRVVSGVIAARIGSDGHEARGASIFANIARVAILVVGALVAFQTMGVEIAPMLTALGVGGLAVALALQPTLSNLFSGIQILMTRKIRPGDLIRLASGEEGFVTDISWRETTIRTLPNNLVMIPNSNLATSQVTNYSLPEPEIGFAVPIPVAHGSDLAAVRALLVDEAAAVQAGPGAIRGFTPVVLIGSLTEVGIELRVILRACDFVAQGAMKSALYERVLERFREHGVSLPIPTRTIIHRGDPRLAASSVDEAGPAGRPLPRPPG